MNSLQEQFTTKKFIGGLIKEYFKKFGETISEKITLMEIGTLEGGFIRFASEYWLTHPESKIIGVDINPRGKYNEKVMMYKCSQLDDHGLLNIGKAHCPFDIIIDDARHKYKHTYNCFKILWPFVKPGGYYIIEDWTVIGSLVSDIKRDMKHYSIENCDIINKGIIKYDKDNPRLAIAFFKKENIKIERG